MEKSDKREKDRVASARSMICLYADDDAKEALSQEDTEGKVALEGTKGVEDRIKLFRVIIENFSTETPTENIHRKVEIFRDIQTCKRNPLRP